MVAQLVLKEGTALMDLSQMRPHTAAAAVTAMYLILSVGKHQI